jgi:hypothetical protein
MSSGDAGFISILLAIFGIAAKYQNFGPFQGEIEGLRANDTGMPQSEGLFDPSIDNEVLCAPKSDELMRIYGEAGMNR